MFNDPRAQTPFHIERKRLKLQSFYYTVEHIYGASNYLSQHSISATGEDLRKTKDLEVYVHYIFQSTVTEQAISSVKRCSK